MTTLVTTCHKAFEGSGFAAAIGSAMSPARAIPLSQAVSGFGAQRLTTLVTSCHKDRSAS
jgi:hypothetical protein